MGAPAVLILTARVLPGRDQAFFAWQSEYGRLVGTFRGFISSDIIPPAQPESREWTLILNFRARKDLEEWRAFPGHAEAAGGARPFLEEGGFAETVPSEGFGENPGANVTEVIFTRIRPGMDEAYREWAARIQAVQAQFSGYRGTYLQPPASAGSRLWTTLLRYDTTGELEAWMNSPERAALLKESMVFVEDSEFLRLAASFPGWVPVNPKGGQAAPNWKIALLVLLGLFPIVMLEKRFLHPALSGLAWGDSADTFLANALSVALTSFIAVPLCIRWFGWWLFPEDADPRTSALKGAGLLAVIFALEIAFFAWLRP